MIRPLDFISWAEHYVNQLDPLHPDPRDPDFAHERSFEYAADEKRTHEELQPFIGHSWANALKLVSA